MHRRCTCFSGGSRMTALAHPPVTFRRDRLGECWHLVPDGDLGPRTRALCGQPRQGTPLSEAYAEAQPEAPECICALCTDAYTRPTASGTTVG